MADVVQELAQLNNNAKELLEKYDGVFKQLDEKAQEILVQLANSGKDGLEKIEEILKNGAVAYAENANKLEGRTLEDLSLEFSSLVVKEPVTDTEIFVTAGYEKSLSFESDSYLDESIYVAKFLLYIDDNEVEVEATDNKATYTHTFSGDIGDKKTLRVVAIDSVGNRSKETTVTATLVENTPPSLPTITAPNEVTKNSIFTITISGSKDEDGDAVTYKIKNKGEFSFSKSENIAENEEITVTAPDVEEDTTFSIVVVAVDSYGLESDESIIEIVVKKIGYGAVDIFSDGSCVEYFPLKTNPYSLVTEDRVMWDAFQRCTNGYVEYKEGDFKSDKFGNRTLFHKYEREKGCSPEIGGPIHITSEKRCRSVTFQWTEYDSKDNEHGGRLYCGLTLNGDSAPLIRNGASPRFDDDYLLVHFTSDGKCYFIDKNGNLVNGVNQGQISRSPNAGFTDIGHYGHNFLRGHFKNLRLFDRDLTDEEIKILANEE